MRDGCDENALLRFGLGLLTPDEAAGMRQHLAECASCVAYLAAVGESDAAVVAELTSIPLERWSQFYAVHSSSFATTAAVQALIQACEDALDHDAKRAIAVSSILIKSADALSPSLTARTLQALAWTRRATAQHRVGNLPEALEAVALAEQRANDIPAADYEQALIAFTAADILRELGRTDEARTRIQAAAEVFARYRDDRRHASAREMEAAVLFRCGEYADALMIFQSLLSSPSIIPDRLTHGRLEANAGQCLAAMGKHDEAMPLFAAAERAFTALGYGSFVARIAWGRSRGLRATGDESGAVALLREVYDRFGELGNDAERIRVGVELVEWLIPMGATDDARALCCEVYERAVHAGMQLQALEAVSHLRNAAIAERLNVDDAHAIRLFLEELPKSPEAEFHLPS